MKEINLLPSNKRFSFRQYIFKKVSVGFMIADLFFLILVYGFNIYLNGKLCSCVTHRKKELNKIISVEDHLKLYEGEYKRLLKKLSELYKEEKKLKSIVFVRRSAFASTIVCFNTFTKNVGFESINYEDGHFNITGLANSLKDFQVFYYSLENNVYLKDLRLYSVKRKGNLFEFKISYQVEY